MPMSTAEAHALSLQANGLLAELTRWERDHKDTADCRISDAISGLRKATRALQHLAMGEEYPESTAARAALRERFADEDADPAAQ